MNCVGFSLIERNGQKVGIGKDLKYLNTHTYLLSDMETRVSDLSKKEYGEGFTFIIHFYERVSPDFKGCFKRGKTNIVVGV